MLKYENIKPNKIAYDKPSQKLVNFLAKHYNLKDYNQQTHNFIVFRQFFDVNFSNFSWKKQSVIY